MTDSSFIPSDEPLVLGDFSFNSRLFLGTGKYATYSQMRDALDISGTECVTVAVRRIPEDEPAGERFLDFLDEVSLQCACARWGGRRRWRWCA